MLPAIPDPRGLGPTATVRLAAAAAVLLAAAVPAPASAAGWSSAQTLSSPATFIDGTGVAFGPRGDALATWTFTNGIGAGAVSGARAARRTAGAGFGPERPFATGLVRRYAATRYVALRTAGGGERVDVRVTLGSLSGGRARRRTLGRHRVFRLRTALAVAANGRAAVAFVTVGRDGRRAVRLSERRPGGRFWTPRIVDRTDRGAHDVAVAVGDRGDLVVAWQRGTVVEARVRRRGGELGPRRRLGPAITGSTDVRAAVARDGAVWVQLDGAPRTEGGRRGPRAVRVATRPARAKRFRPALLLDRNAAQLGGEERTGLAVDPAGTGHVAWTAFDGARTRARVAAIGRDGRLVRALTLSGPGYSAAVGDLATGPRAGEAIVVWARLDAVGELGTQILAGLLGPGGSFAGEEPVSDADRARRPAVAVDPVTGAPTVVWSQRVGRDGPGVPIGEIRTVARASTRMP